MNNLIGIQFDNAEVSLAQYAGGTLKTYNERMPENLIENDHIVSLETFADFMKDIKRRGGFSGRACSIVLPYSSAYFRSLSIPVMNEDQLRLNLPYEFRDFIGTESFKYNFDYAVRGFEYDEEGKPLSMNLMAAAASKDMLDRYALSLKKAGFRLKAAIPIEMSIVNLARSAVKNGAELEHEECIISIGMNHTIFSIIRDGELAAFKIIDIGYAQVDAAIAELYNIDQYLAAGYRESNYEGVLDNEHVNRVYDALGLEIMKTVNFYRYENPDSDIKRISCIGNCGWLNDRIYKAIAYAGFEYRSVSDWLLTGANDEDLSARCALAIGAVSIDE